MTIEVHNPSVSNTLKDEARANWQRGHRSQDHGHRGPSHATSFDEDWVNYAPRRVKAAEQPLEDYDALIGSDTDNPADAPGLRRLSRGIPSYLLVDHIDDGPIDDYDFEDDDDKLPLDPESAEYETAFDELSDFLDRHNITGKERAYAAEQFRNDPALQREFLLLASDFAGDSFATSYEQVDSSNRLDARSKTDNDYDGSFEDDNGDYHVPHMIIRS